MSHIIKCAICKEQFDTDLIPATMYGTNRYAHKACYPTGADVPIKPKAKPTRQTPKGDLPERKILYDLYDSMFKGEDANYGMFTRQVNKLLEDKCTFTGMYKTIYWFLNVKGGDIPNTETFVYVLQNYYKPAAEYYYKLYQANELNKTRLHFLTPEKQTIEINPIEPEKPKIHLFDI